MHEIIAFHCVINLQNAAVADIKTDERARHETARILHDIADRLAIGDRVEFEPWIPHKVRDINGNTIGSFGFRGLE